MHTIQNRVCNEFEELLGNNETDEIDKKRQNLNQAQDVINQCTFQKEDPM